MRFLCGLIISWEYSYACVIPYDNLQKKLSPKTVFTKYVTICDVEKRIVIAVSADEAYGVPICVCVYSLLRNIDKEFLCEINAFVPGTFSDKNRDLLKSACLKFDNCNLVFHDMPDEYNSAPIREGYHVTTPAYYRLNLASRLPNEDKCLYLDVDTIVNADIIELYQTKLDGYYMAGIKAAGFFRAHGEINPHLERLGISSIDTYINTGVVLFNLKAIRDDGMEKAFSELIGKYPATVDQDILNVACFGRIKVQPFKFNVMTKYNVSDTTSYEKNPRVAACYTKEEWEEGLANPVVVHYADKLKPWKDLGADLAEIWWDCFFQCVEDKTIQLDTIGLAIDTSRKATSIGKEQNALIQNLGKEVDGLQKIIEEQSIRIKDLEGKMTALYESDSLKVGLFFTWIPRKIKRLFK